MANWCAGRRRCRERRIGEEPLRLRRRHRARIRSTTNITATRSPEWDKVTVPLFSAANWGGQGLHPRGNFEGFMRAASKQKWLEAHGIEHWTHFYTDYGREQQLQVLRLFPARQGHRLVASSRACCCRCAIPAKDSSAAPRTNGRSKRTKWTKFYLDPADMTLTTKKPADRRRSSSSTRWATGSLS